jgi:hypothetical protein
MNDHGFLAGCGRILAWFGIWLLVPGAAWAEMGAADTFPGPRTKMRNNVTVNIDTRGPVSNGYRCVRVKLSNTPGRNKPPVPVTADRRFRVVIEPWGTGHLAGVATTQVIEIPENQASAEATIAIPSAGDWFQLQLNVYEGGEKLEDVSGQLTIGPWGMRGDDETLPTLLFIDYDVPDRATRDLLIGGATGSGGSNTLPDISSLLADIGYVNFAKPIVTMAPGGMPGRRAMGGQPGAPPTAPSSGPLTDAQILAQAAQHSKVQFLSPAEMSPRWIELSCYDIAFISRTDLAKMARQDAAQRQALVDWLHGGTALVVYGAGDDYSHLAEIEQLLDLRPLPGDDPLRELRGWTTHYASQFVSRPAGLGWVVAVGKDDPFAGNGAVWGGCFNTSSGTSAIPDRHQNWVTRHGMSYQSYNQGLWNWYIPGVGAAPVFSFLLLATLFAIVIGPVNYLFLGRIQRLYLLLVTVPAGAAVVTLCLFAYAVLSDGLGVKARIRSFTLLDQRTGRSVSWSRQSYYASLVPSQGLKYPADTAVWPLDEEPQANRQGARWYQFAWEADGPRLRSGYLSSRRLTQFMVLRAVKTPSKLRVSQSGSAAAPQVTSALGGDVRQLFLRDSQGAYYEAGSPLKAGQSATLKPISANDARQKISQILNDHQPDYPVGYDPAAEDRRADSSWSPRYAYGSVSPTLQASLPE